MNHTRTSHKPFLSICITSYNRVDELYRCLKSIDIVREDMVEIVVSEDCSPRKQEIAQIVDQFASETKYSVTYNTNTDNLGFDRNFAKLIELAKGEYQLFVTDDDAFRKGELDRTIEALRTTDCAVAFTPYFDQGANALARKLARTLLIPSGIKSVERYLYSSILLSGLIFKTNKIVKYSAEQFKNLIYSQVYVFASALYRHGGAYIDVPLVQYIGDGENAFGRNQTGEKNALLADRTSIYSNLEYHKGLIKVVEIFDAENKTSVKSGFAREYSLKAYTGMSLARKVGERELIIYMDKMRSLNIELSYIVDIYYWALKILGCRVCDLIFQFPRTILLALRRRRVPS